MNVNYAVNIIWSAEDEAYIATCLELPGAAADGKTQAEALKNLADVIKEWVAVANEEHREIPNPLTLSDIEKEQDKFKQALNRKIQHEVSELVSKIFSQSESSSDRNVFHLRMTNDLIGCHR